MQFLTSINANANHQPGQDACISATILVGTGLYEYNNASIKSSLVSNSHTQYKHCGKHRCLLT